MPKDVDAHAVWNAKARTAIDRIDTVLDQYSFHPAPVGHLPALDMPAVDMPAVDVSQGFEGSPALAALAYRAMTRTPPPAGEVIVVPLGDFVAPLVKARTMPVNMGAATDRIDHWDSYVCRFEDNGGPIGA